MKRNMNPAVFYSSTVVILAITCFSILLPQVMEKTFKFSQSWLATNVSWFYVLCVGSILFFSLWLMLSRFGNIKLGPDHAQPDHNYFSWFSMLFSAGMGIGLLFFGVAEPLMHFSSPPVGEALSLSSAREAMKISFFHWGLHAWSIYAVVAVTLAYFSYRKDLPLLPRSAFYPFIGNKIYGPIGHCIDTVAVVGTLFGVATSLGFGVAQVNAGLNYLFQVPQTVTVQILLIGAITMCATVSVVLGLDAGIKRLSNLNIILAIVLLVMILILGSTVELLQTYVQNSGAYLSDLIYKTFNLYAYEKRDSWVGGWTLLYWGWWVSWAPFVGMFIARISRGRTIREFMIGVLFIPTGFTFLWFTVFGNSAIRLSSTEGGHRLIDAVQNNVPVALFQFFEFFPFSMILSLVGLTLVVTFFVSSSDSGSLVIDTLASGGSEDPPVWQRIYWALLEGVVAAVLLAAGGLDALQTMTIASAFPMMLLIIFAAIALVKSLKEDDLLTQSVLTHNSVVQYAKASSSWEERLDSLLSLPEKEEALQFMEEVAHPAFEQFCKASLKRGLQAKVEFFEGQLRLVIRHPSYEDFIYCLRIKEYQEEKTGKSYFRVEVYLLNGGKDYDVFGYSKEQIIADAITQYERHLHYVHLIRPEGVN